MNRVCVLKDVAYAAKIGGGTIAGIEEVNQLLPGAIAFFNEQGVLLVNTAGSVNALPDTKEFSIGVGRSEGYQLITNIPRTRIKDVESQVYVAFTKPVITIGGAGNPLTFTNNEEAYVNVYDDSFTTTVAIRSKRSNKYKTASESDDAFLDRVIAGLNNNNPNGDPSFITATKIAGPNFGITVTPKEDGVFIKAAIGGSFEGGSISTANGVYGLGGGAQVLEMEKDASVEEGNSNFINYTDLWYKRAFEADPSVNYDITTVSYEGQHSSPSATKNVMHNNISIAFVNGAATTAYNGDVQVILSALVGEAYTSDEGAEIGN